MIQNSLESNKLNAMLMVKYFRTIQVLGEADLELVWAGLNPLLRAIPTWEMYGYNIGRV